MLDLTCDNVFGVAVTLFALLIAYLVAARYEAIANEKRDEERRGRDGKTR